MNITSRVLRQLNIIMSIRKYKRSINMTLFYSRLAFRMVVIHVNVVKVPMRCLFQHPCVTLSEWWQTSQVPRLQRTEMLTVASLCQVMNENGYSSSTCVVQRLTTTQSTTLKPNHEAPVCVSFTAIDEGFLSFFSDRGFVRDRGW